MVRTRLGAILGALLLYLIPYSWIAAEEIDAKDALRKMFETRDQLVSGRCWIVGYSSDGYPAHDEDPEDHLHLVFDNRIPAYFLEDGTDSAYLATAKNQYHAQGNRQRVRRYPIEFELSAIGILPFEMRSLGFSSDPSHTSGRRNLSYAEWKAWFEKAEILESEQTGDQIRILVKLPRPEGGHYDLPVQLWLDASRDFVTTRIEQRFVSRDGFVFRSEMLWEKQHGVWVVSNFRQFRHVREQQPRTSWKLTWAEVNEPIPENAFALENLPNPGRTATLQTEKGPSDWETIRSNVPGPEGNPDWSVLPPVEETPQTTSRSR